MGSAFFQQVRNDARFIYPFGKGMAMRVAIISLQWLTGYYFCGGLSGFTDGLAF
jgi:hypothetical protein